MDKKKKKKKDQNAFTILFRLRDEGSLYFRPSAEHVSRFDFACSTDPLNSSESAEQSKIPLPPFLFPLSIQCKFSYNYSGFATELYRGGWQALTYLYTTLHNQHIG